MKRATDRGHRIQPHTADVIIHAWGPDLGACCQEAVTALVETCVDGGGAAVRRRIRHRIAAGPPESMLLDLLDEIIFLLDTEPDVVIAAQIDEGVDGRLVADILLADRDQVEIVGSAPKAISRSELRVDDDGRRVRCSFLVDV